ncbi:hypothetical protein [Nevskia soli]|uniref:hypothetical protein n=1 Tax=Nevskia soli TaxID=418856 RepID=UPI0012F8B788|nr:hypothetical protein [Nevskia soli]
MKRIKRAMSGAFGSFKVPGCAVALLGLAACSSAPVVDYSPANTGVVTPHSLNETRGQYALWTTALHFKKDAGGEMTVSAATAADPAQTNVLMIAGEDHWYKTTAVTLVTASDSDVLSTVDVTVTDHLASYITTAAELTVTGLTAVRSSGPNPCSRPDRVPAVAADAAFDEELNVYAFLRQLDQGCPGLSSDEVPARLVGFAGDGVPAVAVLSVEPPPASALELNHDDAAAVLGAAKNVFLFPACRNATLQYRSTLSRSGVAPQLVTHTVHFRFSDPRYVQAIPLPVKGALTVKPQCGMTLQSDAGDAGTAAEVAKAMADAVQSVAGAAKAR